MAAKARRTLVEFGPQIELSPGVLLSGLIGNRDLLVATFQTEGPAKVLLREMLAPYACCEGASSASMATPSFLFDELTCREPSRFGRASPPSRGCRPGM